MTGRLLLGGTLAAAAQLAAVGLLLTSAWLVVRAAEQPPVLYLLVAIVGVRFFGVGRAVLRYAERLLTHDAALARTVEARVAVNAALERLAPHGLNGRRHGDLVQHAVQDVDAVADRLLRIRLPWSSAVIASAVLALVVGLVVPAAGGVVALGAVTIMLLLRRLVPRTVPPEPAGASAEVTELVRWADELVVHGSDAGRLARVHRAIDAQAVHDRRDAATGGLGQLLVLIGTAVTVLLVALVLEPALGDGSLRPVLTGVVLLAPLALVDVLEAVADAERRRPVIEAAEARLDDLLAAPAPLSEPVRDRAVPTDTTLELDGVTVGWDHDLVRDVSAVIRPGSLWGISAPSGAGKSTLAWTMARFVAPRAGAVRLGGVDLADLRGDTVRRVVGVMAQDETVFDTTVRENLRIARPEATDAELLAAMDRAGLHLDLDREVGEHGSRLSGGERQRLTLARLLLGEHPVLVLDEPTEHLDAPLATALVDDLVALAPEHTVVLVSHDPDVLARCDHVLTLAPSMGPRLKGCRPNSS